MSPAPVTAVAVVGAGTIGLSFARLFASRGLTVHLSDPRPGLTEAVDSMCASCPEIAEQIEIAHSLDEAVAQVSLVQECGPERPEIKSQLFSDIAEAAQPDSLLVSSSSAITATQITARLSDEIAARTIIGHPFNPPHVMPLIEVVPGERTAPETTEQVLEFYRGLGRAPVLLHKEVPGFVGNRLQSAVLKEATWLVESGVVSTGDLDVAVQNSIGLRWAAVGFFAGFHLGGGEDGFRGFMEHIGPSLTGLELGQPDYEGSAMETVYSQVEEAYGVPPADWLAEQRDRLQSGMLELRAETEGHGEESDGTGETPGPSQEA